MVNTGRKSLRSLIIAVPLLVVVVWACMYHPFEFKGGITVRDSGFFTYPRYHAELAHIPLGQNGEYQFKVSGLPPGPLNLKLRVSNSGHTEVPELSSLSTAANVSVIDNSGRELCSASGRLSDAKMRGIGGWVLESSASNASFWHPACENLAISRFRTYIVKVTLSEVDPHSPNKQLTPILEGGGTELP